MYDVIVIGGGIAGLISSNLLSRSGLHVALFEKKEYPFHRVCGEYVSNEVKPFLTKNNLFPDEINPSSITDFQLTSTNGKKASLRMDMGGFGISRYSFDHFLYKQAIESGVEVFQSSTVSEVNFLQDYFEVKSKGETYQSRWVIGSHGKRSTLDKGRRFMQKKSPYIGVKYHIKTDFPSDLIALHNFKNGYCGISKVEQDIYNLCYLSHRDNLKKHQSIEAMESHLLHENPFLKSIWQNSEFLFEKPLVINEISFAKKELIYDHILMCGDTAGMITPLCGNGMAMAIHASKILTEILIQNWKQGDFNRTQIENQYIRMWNKQFSKRLLTGRTLQQLFGAKWSSNLAVKLLQNQSIGHAIVKLTHGPTL